ncbi:hypothetical protein D3OALGA1CA_3467 [Olavius algarvensis associated proteobacterium Delta 3]|nr:hypothetical protein D3OALGA1CA_3467 [Olavius algarvensis associated proteobacterium Delta 3]
MNLKQLSESCSDLWIVDAVERCRVIGIGIGFGFGIDIEVSHSISIPNPIPIPNMSIYGLPRNGIRLTKTHYVQTEYTATTIYPETRFNP